MRVRAGGDGRRYLMGRSLSVVVFVAPHTPDVPFFPAGMVAFTSSTQLGTQVATESVLRFSPRCSASQV
jgi:hypothetical protein